MIKHLPLCLCCSVSKGIHVILIASCITFKCTSHPKCSWLLYVLVCIITRKWVVDKSYTDCTFSGLKRDIMMKSVFTFYRHLFMCFNVLCDRCSSVYCSLISNTCIGNVQHHSWYSLIKQEHTGYEYWFQLLQQQVPQEWVHSCSSDHGHVLILFLCYCSDLFQQYWWVFVV